MGGRGIIPDTTATRVKHRNGGRGADFRGLNDHAFSAF
jgi:hypothetical protein